MDVSLNRFVVVALSVLIVVMLLPNPADAGFGPLHRYSFSEPASEDATGLTIVDSVSGANGTILGAGSSTTGDQLVLDGGPSATAAYVDLPNGMISVLSDATFEAWYTMDSVQNWARLYDFGSSGMTELPGPGGTGNGDDSHFFAVSRGGDINGQRISLANNDPAGGQVEGVSPAPFVDIDPEFTQTLGEQVHIAVVIDAGGGTIPTGSAMTVYINGGLAMGNDGGNDVNPRLDIDHQLGQLNDVNNWLGRSNWTADNNFGGSYNEFRIWDSVLSEEQISYNAAVGPNIIAEPSPLLVLEADPNSGNVRLLNNVDFDLTFNYYEITSAMGALDPDGWNSLADQDGGGPGFGWDESGGSNENQLIEFYLGEGENGFTLAGGASKFLGAAFDTSVFGEGNDGDLVLAFGLNGQTTLLNSVGGLLADVRYVEVLPPEGVLGDYNNDGVVNAADYVTFRNALASGGTLMNESASPGVTDQADYDYWVTRFGATSGNGSGESAAVPEPATFVTFLVACGILFVRRTR